MKSNLTSILFVSAMLSCCLTPCNLRPALAENSSPERDAKIEKLVSRWQKVFGPVDFRPEDLFSVMLHVGAHPLESMGKLDERKISPQLMKENMKWLKAFLKPEYRHEIGQPNYFRMSPTSEVFTDILFYEVKEEKFPFRFYDNASMMAFMIKPQNYDKKQEIEPQQLVKLLSDFINLPYESHEQVAAAFKITKTLRMGDAVTNSSDMYPQLMQDWRKKIIVFLGKEGVNIVCFKRSVPPEAPLYFEHKAKWLEGYLFESDGVTPVKRSAE
jgi:hypothetical protein